MPQRTYARNSKNVQVKPLLLPSYLAVARGSADSTMFQKYYCEVNGEKMEVLQEGNRSCAFYATAILKIFGLVRNIQVTVHRAHDEMRVRGWRKIKERRPGCVVFYAAAKTDLSRREKDRAIYSQKTRHMGIYVGEDTVVTNLALVKRPVLKPWNYRPVEMFLWHRKLDA